MEKQEVNLNSSLNKKINRKKFRTYVYDFFMLFIAISAGFFMENLRESHVERKKESRYIEKIIADIKVDTADIRQISEANDIQIAGIDSLLQVMDKPFHEIDVKKFYYHIFTHLNSYKVFSAREITIAQLKSSGDFRLIRNNAAADSIVLYYSVFDAYKDQIDYNKQTFREIINLELELLDFRVGRDPNGDFILRNSEKMHIFYNLVMIAYYMRLEDNKWLAEYKQMGENVLSALQAEYQIEP